VQDIDDPLLAQSLGLLSTEGALITDIVRESPADKAGLQPGDVIIEINGVKVRSSEEAKHIVLSGGTVGDVYHLKVIREGEEVDKTIRLEEQNQRSSRRR
jgi:S1-C subfamily serine protease